MAEEKRTEERYEQLIQEIRSIKAHNRAAKPYRDYFDRLADFALQLASVQGQLSDGSYERLSLPAVQQINRDLYQDVRPDSYGQSYANPTYANARLTTDYGPLLCFFYRELRGAIPAVFEGKIDQVNFLLGTCLSVYEVFCQAAEPDPGTVEDLLTAYAYTGCDLLVADFVRSQLSPDDDFAARLILDSDPKDLRYLYRFGEYVGDNEYQTAVHLAGLPEDVIRKMADVYTEGYRIGFETTGRDLNRKSTVNIRYVLGFERVIKRAIENFRSLGLTPILYRNPVSALCRRSLGKIGYYGGTANPQYDYDHRQDQALFVEEAFLDRKLSVIEQTYAAHQEAAAGYAGPACLETFGETPFIPEQKKEAICLSKAQEELLLSYDQRQSQIVNTYVPGDETSFTIVAYPVPEIGPDYPAIFDEIIRINTLDSKAYTRVQQTLIDALNEGESVRVLGQNGNHTNLSIKLHPLTDPAKETIFENCVADVNIPVGEVFTSPVLTGTNGTLEVSKVYLNDLEYEHLSITFVEGMVQAYTCKNFPDEAQNQRYIHDNVLMGHDTLPMGEFAIGTNTTAYVTARKYGIQEKMPILIAEKMGPHFALGDTCYSWSEDVKVYNPDGKEIIARDNEISLRRKEDASKAYFHCHTDITIPYEEIGSLCVVRADGSEIPLLTDGRFVLPGTEMLNEPFNEDRSRSA